MKNNLTNARSEFVCDFLDKASKAYYEGAPIISDSQFDALAETYSYRQVGYVQPTETLKHFQRLYSLHKYYDGEGIQPLRDYSKPKVVSPKLDGSAISALYVDKYLVQVLTRGDGISGTDITNKFLSSSKAIIPKTIDIGGIIQVDGEITTTLDKPNARNYAAGALSLLSQEEFDSRELYFTAYNKYPRADSYTTDMNVLYHLGFHTIMDEEWCSQFPQDGIVIRVNDNSDYEALGFTNSHPRGAYALKTRQEGVVTTLTSVEWQVGRTGKVTPVAVFDQIVIDGAKINRATLNNVAFIEALDLELGCQVEVIRAGHIIPTVVRKV